MTTICVYRKKKDIVKYTMEGHSDFGAEGEDIVCASVSTLAYTVLNGLTDVVGLQVGYEVREAYLECILPCDLTENQREKADVLLDSMLMSLKNLEKQYGDYITITELEVE